MKFTPRLNDSGMKESKYYNDPAYNSFCKQASTKLPNCTCYCMGRWTEIYGKQIKDLFFGTTQVIGDAKYWYNANSGNCPNPTFKRGSVAKLGAILCFDGNAGHVAVVEKIEGDKVTISYSEHGGAYFGTKTDTFKVGTAYTKYGWGKVQGYIYFPEELTIESAKKAQDYLYRAIDVIDGKYGNEPERSDKLEAEGYNASKVQALVNKALD